MVVYCKVPYGEIARWCEDQGYTELPTGEYNQNSNPLLIVDRRINPSFHDVYIDSPYDAKRYIKEHTKGGNIYFGIRRNVVDYIGSESLVVWSKK